MYLTSGWSSDVNREFRMAEPLRIVEANRLNYFEVVVGFSGGTTDTFTADNFDTLKIRNTRTCGQQSKYGPSRESKRTLVPLLKA